MLKTKKPSKLTGRNVRLSNLLISCCLWQFISCTQVDTTPFN